MKTKSILMSMAVLVFALGLPHESWAQNGKFKKVLRKAAAFAVGVAAINQGEDAATAMEMTTWALGGDEYEMQENANMANYTFEDLKEDVSYKVGEKIVNMQEEKEQKAIEERREERRLEEQYNNVYNNNVYNNNSMVSESFEDVNVATINSNISYEDNTADLEVTLEKSEELHEYVDLGLPSGLKWATCNIGADVPEESGYYFECEDITTIESIVGDYENYENISDNAQFDITADNWRIPTYYEMQELLDNCSWIWTTQQGQGGYKVIGPNGNSIFLPAAGLRHEETLNYVGNIGYYWSSTPGDSDGAYYLRFDSSEHSVNVTPYYSRTVRLVVE